MDQDSAGQAFNHQALPRLRRGERGYVDRPNQIVGTDGELRLHCAVIEGDEALVIRLLRSGADPDAADAAGNTALHHAAWLANVKIAKILFSYGASADRSNAAGNTALRELLNSHRRRAPAPDQKEKERLNQRDTLRRDTLPEKARIVAYLFLDHGADVDAQSADGSSIVHSVVSFFDHTQETRGFVRRVLMTSKSPDARNVWGETPYYTACAYGRDDLLEDFALLPVDPCGAAEDGDTPLSVSVLAEDTRCTLDLLQGPAIATLNVANAEGDLPILRAIRRGKTRIVRRMLDLGAFTNTPDKQGYAALHTAAIAGDIELTAMVHAAGGAADGCFAPFFESPLLLSLRHKAPAIARFLLDHGAPVDRADHRGITPLMEAAALGAFDVVERLLAEGADPSHVDCNGRNVLHYCEEGIPADLLDRLILAGADIDQADKEGFVPLTIAIGECRPTLSRALIARGAGIYPVHPQHGMLPIHVAALTGQAELVQLFLDLGVPVDVCDKNGYTALHHAVTRRKGALETVKFLMCAGANLFARSRDSEMRALSDGGDIIRTYVAAHTPIDLAVRDGIKEIEGYFDELWRAVKPDYVVTKPLQRPFGLPTVWM